MRTTAEVRDDVSTTGVINCAAYSDGRAWPTCPSADVQRSARARLIASSGSACTSRTRRSASRSPTANSAFTIWPSKTRSRLINAQNSNCTEAHSSLCCEPPSSCRAASAWSSAKRHVFVGRALRRLRPPRLAQVARRSARRCEAAPHLLSKGPGFVLYALMDFIVDQYLPDRRSTRGAAGGSRRRDFRRALRSRDDGAHLSV